MKKRMLLTIPMLALSCLMVFAQTVEELLPKAEEGDVEAQIALGSYYKKAKGHAKDLEKSIFWYREAAEQGDAESQNYLGDCYYKGTGVAKNWEKARFWYRKAAEQDLPAAQQNATNLQITGDYNIVKNTYSSDLAKALAGLEKLKSKPSDKTKQEVVASFEGIMRNNVSEQGLAVLYLAELYSMHSPESLRDLPLSFKYYKMADSLLVAENNPDNKSLAVYNIGLCYYRGAGVTQNLDSAAVCFQQAADLSPARGAGIGELYEFGIGVPQNLSRAMSYYHLAILNGTDAYAKFYSVVYMIEKMYSNSLDTIACQKFKESILLRSMHDDVKAGREPLIEAAAQGYAPAQFELAAN